MNEDAAALARALAHRLNRATPDHIFVVAEGTRIQTTERWPAHGSGPLPLPWATVDHGELLCGFDDILVLEPIPLADLV